jgi:hypothetical protein
MLKLTPLFTAAALGAAMVLSSGAHYELAARQLAIYRTPSAEIFQAHAASKR